MKSFLLLFALISLNSYSQSIKDYVGTYQLSYSTSDTCTEKLIVSFNNERNSLTYLSLSPDRGSSFTTFYINQRNDHPYGVTYSKTTYSSSGIHKRIYRKGRGLFDKDRLIGQMMTSLTFNEDTQSFQLDFRNEREGESTYECNYSPK